MYAVLSLCICSNQLHKRKLIYLDSLHKNINIMDVIFFIFTLNSVFTGIKRYT
jgi:hypothetical protein